MQLLSVTAGARLTILVLQKMRDRLQLDGVDNNNNDSKNRKSNSKFGVEFRTDRLDWKL